MYSASDLISAVLKPFLSKTRYLTILATLKLTVGSLHVSAVKSHLQKNDYFITSQRRRVHILTNMA